MRNKIVLKWNKIVLKWNKIVLKMRSKRSKMKHNAMLSWLVVLAAILCLLAAGTVFRGTELLLFLSLGLLGAVFITAVAFLIIWFWLAPSNFFFTFVKEGSAKIVVRGDKFEKALIQWEGRTFNYSAEGEKKWNVIKGNEPWHPFGGLRYCGFWPIKAIYGYYFQWSGVAEDGQIVRHPKEPMDYILLKEDVFWAKVEKAEDKKLLPLEIEIVLTVRIVNPYRALFNIQSWLETVINRIGPTVRDITTQDEYENWIGQKEAMGQQIHQKARKILKEFRERYGVDVLRIQVKDINPPEDFLVKTLEPYFAELDKRAIVTRAEAEGARIRTVFSQIKDFGDVGKLIRTLEAAERSPLAASLTVQAIPGLQEILRGVFGKPPETISKEDIGELRKLIEKLTKTK